MEKDPPSVVGQTSPRGFGGLGLGSVAPTGIFAPRKSVAPTGTGLDGNPLPANAPPLAQASPEEEGLGMEDEEAIERELRKLEERERHERVTIPLLRKHTMRERFIYFLNTSMVGIAFEMLQLTLAVVWCALFVIETYYQKEPAAVLVFRNFDLALSVIFILFAVFRFYLTENKIAFWYAGLTILDYVTIIPAILRLANASGASLGWLRALYTLRLIRVVSTLRKFNLKGIVLPLARLFVVIITIIFLAAALVLTLEPENLMDFHTAVYYVVISLTTVGYGDFSMKTPGGRLLISGMIVMSFILVPVVGFWIADIVQSQPKSHEREYKTNKKKTHHVIITGHINVDTVRGVLKNLLSEARSKYMPHKVVVLHPDKPTYAFKNRVTIPFQPLVLYLQGSCLNQEDLARSRLESASAVFVMSNPFSTDPAKDDYNTMMRILSVRSYDANVPIFAQVLRSHSSAEVESISRNVTSINLSYFRLGILAETTIVPGFSTLISNLIKETDLASEASSEPYTNFQLYDYGQNHELFIIASPPPLQGLTFREAAKIALREKGCVLMAIQKKKEVKPADFDSILDGDSMIHVIAPDMDTAHSLSQLDGTKYMLLRRVTVKRPAPSDLGHDDRADTTKSQDDQDDGETLRDARLAVLRQSVSVGAARKLLNKVQKDDGKQEKDEEKDGSPPALKKSEKVNSLSDDESHENTSEDEEEEKEEKGKEKTRKRRWTLIKKKSKKALGISSGKEESKGTKEEEGAQESKEDDENEEEIKEKKGKKEKNGKTEESSDEEKEKEDKEKKEKLKSKVEEGEEIVIPLKSEKSPSRPLSRRTTHQRVNTDADSASTDDRSELTSTAGSEEVVKKKGIHETIKLSRKMKGHIVLICDVIHWLEMTRFLAEGHPDLAIVFLSEEKPQIEVWAKIQLMVKAHLVVGSPLHRRDLLRAGAERAAFVFLLNRSHFVDIPTEESDKEPALSDRNTVLVYNLISRLFPHVIIIAELRQEENYKYLRSGTTQTSAFRTLIPAYGSGHIYSPSVIEALCSQAYYNPSMLSILETLLLHNNTRFSLNAWLIKPLPGFKGTNFGQLFEYLIERDALLIGLYRYGHFLPDSLTGGQQEPLSKFSRFVLTAPPAYAPLVLIPPNNADYFYIICTQNTIDALGAEVFRETARVPGTSARSSNAGL